MAIWWMLATFCGGCYGHLMDAGHLLWWFVMAIWWLLIKFCVGLLWPSDGCWPYFMVICDGHLMAASHVLWWFTMAAASQLLCLVLLATEWCSGFGEPWFSCWLALWTWREWLSSFSYFLFPRKYNCQYRIYLARVLWSLCKFEKVSNV